MRLIVAEKPSLARAIAAAIPGRHRTVARHIECATGDVIAWCAGHILQMAPPEDYSPDLAKWTLEALPIVPSRWRHRVSAPELVESIRALLRKASRVVHAGDPDREGQLLVDEVLLHLGWHGPTDRLLVNDLSRNAIERALAELEPNDRYRALSDAALARQRADWLFGMNLSRLYTLRAGLSGYQGVLSVGRVQTPLLGIIVRRDRDIETFVSKPFFGVEAMLRTAAGEDFRAEWAVGKEHSALLDTEGRLLDPQLAALVAAKVAGRVGTITEHEQTPHSEEAPLPYSLATLQIDTGRKLGLSAARVLEVAQRLYERQLLTYPRSDCTHLPEEHFGQARDVIAAVVAHAPTLVRACVAADFGRRGRAWNDAKVTAHHAIIPTANRAPSDLDPIDRSVYELVARRYVQLFLPPFEYLQTSVTILVSGEVFRARGRQVTARGWKAFDEAENPGADEGDDLEQDTPLPPLVVGEKVACASARVRERRTKPPRAFTDASLIQAMCHVSELVTDPALRKVLKETDGIGTPATRATIIELLVARGFVERRKKQIRSTAVGRAFVAALPSVATKPDLTAVWEQAIQQIEERRVDIDRFLGAVARQLGELVARGKAAGALPLPSLPAATGGHSPRGSRARQRRKSGKSAGAAPRRSRGGSPRPSRSEP
jgi:DNA topoisomerase III